MSAIWEDPIGNAKEEFEREQEKKLASQKLKHNKNFFRAPIKSKCFTRS